MDANILIRIGDQYLYTGSKEALLWYSTAAALDPERDLGLRLDFAAALANDPLHEPQIPGLVHRLEDRVLQISGTELHWLRERPQHEISLGMVLRPNRDGVARIWWNDHVGLIIYVDEPGHYRLSMRVLHAPPAPIEMAIGINGVQLRNVSLERGDSSAEIISVVTQLERGLHLLGIWYLNDAIVDGVDRNAEVEWVRVEKAR